MLADESLVAVRLFVSFCDTNNLTAMILLQYFFPEP